MLQMGYLNNNSISQIGSGGISSISNGGATTVRRRIAMEAMTTEELKMNK